MEIIIDWSLLGYFLLAWMPYYIGRHVNEDTPLGFRAFAWFISFICIMGAYYFFKVHLCN